VQHASEGLYFLPHAMVRSGKIAVLGVPAAAGAGRPGVEDAPAALREAGLIEALCASGATIENLVDLALFPFRADPAPAQARNLSGVACAVRATADEVARIAAEGLVLVLGGGCSLTAGVAAGLTRVHGRPPAVVWLDAHADLNTPATTRSGLLDGMALALTLGRGPEDLAAVAPCWTSARHVALLGHRDLDPPERDALPELGLARSAAELRRLGGATAAQQALGVVAAGAQLLVHLDVDVIDPQEMPAKQDSPRGPALSLAEAGALLTRLLAAPAAAAVVVTGFAPHLDVADVCARRLVGLLAEALG
jgi:arginase